MADTSFLNRKRCLVLDDEFLIALDIQQVLEAAGATAVCASGAAEALMLLDAEASFDLAILDVRLSAPNDATDDAKSVAAVLAERNTPFIFVTGMCADEVRAAHFPQAPVIEKPYDPARLMAAVQALLTGPTV